MDRKGMTRRGFVGTMGVAGLSAAGLSGCAPTTRVDLATEAVPEEKEIDLTGWEEMAPLVKYDPDDDMEMMRVDMSWTDLNEIRRAAIDSCEDYVCEDGTVIPKIWVQVREVVDSLGTGVSAQTHVTDDCFNEWMFLCNHDERLASIYVNSPIGRRFTALDAANANGITEEEAVEALNALAFNGILFRTKTAGIDYFSHQRVFHGIVESSMNLYSTEGYIDALRGYSAGGPTDRVQTPYGDYYPIPANKDVVIDGKVLPYDDIESLLNRHEVFCVSPCQCVYFNGKNTDFPDVSDREAIKDHILSDGVHLEKCFTFGEEAQFYIDLGIGRQIERDEMRELLKRSADEGCILQSCYTKYTEVICSCNKQGCMPTAHLSFDEEGNPEKPSYYAGINNYVLLYNKELCTKCGTCFNRCIPGAITWEPGSYPEVTGACFRCGQCAYVCPASARKLKAREENEIPYLPDDLNEWGELDAVWRYEKGLWPIA